jgi:hypothetical protein
MKSNVSQDEIDKIFSKLMDLKSKLPGVNSIVGGKCYFIEDSEFKLHASHGFTIDFTDEKARDNFMTNSICDDVKDHIINSIEGGYASLMGFEFRDKK